LSPDVDVLVVGAGVVGLATAAALGSAGRSVWVAERAGGVGRETSSRNSGVVHAGLYYPDGSLKARTCVRGRELLYERCERRRIGHRRCGKVVVAANAAEAPALEALARRAEANGVPGLRWLDTDEVAALEPCVRAHAGLLSPATGIVDAHELVLSYAAEAESFGVRIALATEVVALERAGVGWRAEARDRGGGWTRVKASAVVNAAGLSADRVAALAGVDVAAAGYRVHPCKGDYFAVAPGAPLRFERLVYPLHGAAGLGVHVGFDVAGRLRLGPDAEYVDAPRYDIDPAKADHFAAAAAQYLPGLRAEWLSPDQAGVRPKLAGPGEPVRDFVVAEESARGLPGLVNLVGIESPGLTAAGAIAEEVAGLLVSL
jgi:L-2-hydroxyglutarate oxidase LhgO